MPPKRKRPERSSFDTGRPSPHRPADTTLAQHERDEGGRGRRGSVRGGNNNRRDSSQSSNRGAANAAQNGSPSVRRSNSTSNAQTMPPPSSPANPSSTMKPPPHAVTFVDTTQASPVTPLIDYRYDNLTDEKIRSWAERGRNEVVAHGIQSREDEDITELSNLFQEFIHAVIDGRLDPKNAGACVKEILGKELSEDEESNAFTSHALFLDSLSIILDIGSNRFHPSLRDFLMATGISTSLMRQILDAAVLQELGLTRSAFAKNSIRYSTNQLYRQANYNLLREESEGYSKLITELYMTSDVLAPEVPEQTFEKIKALIGTFDLDVGRALDVTMDVAASVLVKQFRFFVKLLRISSWWPRTGPTAANQEFTGGLPTWATPGYQHWETTEEDEAKNAKLRLARDITFWDRAREAHLAAFFELGGRRPATAAAQDAITNGVNGHSNVDVDSEKAWIEATNTLPPAGNHVAAQLLGFKLLFYYGETRDQSDVLPANLLYLAALLMKIGFISLADLWTHLSPNDDDMEKVREKKLKEIEDEERKARGGGQMNALLMAGALPEGEDENPNGSRGLRAPPKKAAEPEKKEDTPKTPEAKLDEPLEQKVILLIQLLTIGALPESLFILGRFPWIPEVFPEVLDAIHRILHVSLEKVYSESRPVANPAKPTECPAKLLPSYDQTGLPKGSVRLCTPPTKKSLRWPHPDRLDHNSQDYRYYWDEWTDNIPVCQTVDDVFTLCDTFLNTSGVNIGKDESLLSKIATIGSKSLYEDTSSENLARWQTLLRRLLLPALSHTKANTSVVNAVWNLLKRYPMTTRYSLYAEWFEGQISRVPAMKTAFARAQAETRATMKRVSLTNLSEMAKRLAKTSYSSPGIVFRVAFEQLESYPNLIEAFVECAKYFTDLSYDVLVWSLMNSLGKSRSRTQAEHALTTSKWLTALSKFTGKVYRRYPMLSPTPVLQYVNHQLIEGNSTDLIILKEFISSMGGVVDASDFSDLQILQMAGGDYLRRFTLIKGGDKRFDNIKSSQRLIKALTDTNLAAVLLTNLAQFRQAAIFQVPEDEAHIKYLSSLIDDSHQILIRYLDFLWSNLDTASYDKFVPPITALMSDFGLDPSLAFLIGRASLSARMFPWKTQEAAAAKEKPQVTATEVDRDGDATMSDKAPDGSTNIPDLASNEEQVGTPQASPPTVTNAIPLQKSRDSSIQTALQPIIDSVQETMPSVLWQKITPELYVTFWALQLGDVFCLDKIYAQEKSRLQSEEKAIEDRSDMLKKKGGDIRTEQKLLEQRKRLTELRIGLSEECSEHMLRQGKWRLLLSKQFQASFPEPRASPEKIADALLEQCFIPRVLLSPSDAEYTYRFIKALHEWNAPGFKLMSLYDRLFNANRLRSLIFTCTVREADYLGRFLKLILEDLSRWHKNDPIPGDRGRTRLGAYDKEGKGAAESPRLGFATEFDENGKPKAFVDHAQFQDLLFRWHKNLNMALKSCLAGTEWMHIRNAITVLKCVLDFFPAIDFMATQFSSQLQKITRQEAASGGEGHRVDLSVAAQGAMSELQRRKSKWMMVQAFRPNSVGGSQPDAHKPTDLRATAAEFTPSFAKPTGKPNTAEEEDGEVRDGMGKAVANFDDKAGDSLPPRPGHRDSRRDVTPNSVPARSSTPKPSQPSGSSGLRNDSRPPTLPERPPQSLPTRPDVPIPGHFPERAGHGRTLERGRETRDSREPREPRAPRDPRDGRDPRDTREPRDPRETRDHRDPRDNWPATAEWQDRNRDHPDRRAHDARDSSRPDLLSRHVPPHERERSHRDARDSRSHDVPRVPSASTAQAAPPPVELAINPERAALILGDAKPPPARHEPEPIRARRQPLGDPVMPPNVGAARPTSIGDALPPRRDDIRDRARAHSPRGGRRHDQPPPGPRHEQGLPAPPAHDDRSGRPTDHRSGRDPREHSPLPGAYRGERPMDRASERGPGDKSRDPPAFPRPTSRGQEHDYRAPVPDPSYGRLNAVEPVNEAPSGPRGPRGRGSARGGPLPPPHAPSGPMPQRSDSRFGGSDALERHIPTGPERHVPTGPSSGRGRRGYEPHGAPPHNVPPPPPSGPMHHQDRNMRDFSNVNKPPASTPGVHPDRLAQLGHSQTSTAPPPPPPPPPPGGPPPHHSRHSMGSTQTPDKLRSDQRPSTTAPTPSSEPRDSRGGNGSRRQLGVINNVLAANKPESSRASSTRSRLPRQTLGNSDAQVLTGGSPQTPAAERADPLRTTGATDATKEDRRSHRSSRRSSRDRERERSPTREKDPNYRDRRERKGREKEGMAPGRERRDGRRDERRDAGRKRRSEEGGSEREKRVRR